MPSLTRRALAVLAVAVGALPAPAQFVFNQPTTGTTGTFTAAYPAPFGWQTPPGVPTAGGAADASITFSTLARIGNGFVLTNDLAGQYQANGLTFNSAGTATFTARFGNGLQLTGANPTVTVSNLGAAQLDGGTAGVVLNPTTGSTTVGGAGNGAFAFGSTSPATVISGTGGLTHARTGNGITTLVGANTFTGGVFLNGGVLQVTTDANLGAAANGLAFDGGTLRVGTALTSARAVTVGAGGATIAGTAALTLSSPLAGAGPLRKLEASTLTLTGASTGFTGAVAVGSAVPVAVGSVLATANTSTLALSGAGQLNSTTGITVNPGAALSVVRGTSPLTVFDRLGAAPLTLNGGSFTYSPGSAAADSTTQLGAVTIPSGLGVVRTTSVAGPATGTALPFGPLSRANNSVLAIGASTSGAGQVGGTPSANTTNLTFAGLADSGGTGTARNVVPWAFQTTGPVSDLANNLLTYDNNGFRPLAASELATGLTAGANSNLTATANTLTGNLSVLSVQDTNAVLSDKTISGAFTLGITSGAFAFYNTTTVSNTTLAFGAAPGFLYHGDDLLLTGTANVTGSGGLVVAGSSTSYRTSFAAANSFTGGLFAYGRQTSATGVTAGVIFTADNQLGAAGQPVTLNGGELRYNNGTADAALAGRTVTLAGGGLFNVVTTARTLSVPGPVAGPGTLIKSGPGTLALTNPAANTYSGGTNLTAGTLQAGAANQLGTGPVFLSGGTLQAAGPLAFGAADTPNTLTLTAGSTLDTQANTVTVARPLSSVGNFTLTKAGTGTLALTAASPLFASSLQVNAGTLSVSGAATLPQLFTAFVPAGGTFLVDNTAAYLPDRLGDQSSLLLRGGVASFVAGAATATPAERVGSLRSDTTAGGVFSVTGAGAVRFGLLDAGVAITVRGTDLGAASGTPARVFFDNLTADVGILPNVFFADTPGTTPTTTRAGYSTTRGVIAFTPVAQTGTVINNLAGPQTDPFASFTTTGDTTAVTGAQVFRLALDGGSTLTLTGGNAATSPPTTPNNAGTPDGTLRVAGGELIATGGAKTVTSDVARTLSLGTEPASITTTADLTLDTTITLTGAGGVRKLGAGTLTVNGTVGATGPGLIAAAGTVTLPTSAAFATGAVVGSADAGTLSVQTTAAVPSLAVSGGTTNLPAGGTVTAANLSGGTVNLQGSASVGTLAATSGATVTIPAGASLAVTGSGSVSAAAITGAGGVAHNPTSATVLTLGGASTFTGGVTGNAFARLVATSSQAFGTGPVNLSAQTANSSFSTPTLGYNFGATGATGTLPNAFTFTAAAVEVYIAQVGFTGQTLTLSGPLAGGGAATNFIMDTTGSTQAHVVALTNPANTLTGVWSTTYGTLAVSSGGAVGNLSNLRLNNLTSPTNGSLRFDAPNVALPAGLTVTATATSAAAINTNGFTGTLLGPLAGANPVAKTGAGTLVLAGTNTFTGALTVSAGGLQVNGPLPGTAAVTVAAGATLGGTGTIGSGTGRAVAFQAGSTLAPGASIGTLGVTGSTTLTGGTTPTVWAIELNGIAPNSLETANTTDVDRLTVSGTLNFVGSGTNRIRLDLSQVGGAFTDLTQPVFYSIATAGTVQTNGGAFDPSVFDFAGTSFQPGSVSVSQLGGSVILQFVPVPEPATVLLAGAAGLAGVRVVRRRRAA